MTQAGTTENNNYEERENHLGGQTVCDRLRQRTEGAEEEEWTEERKDGGKGGRENVMVHVTLAQPLQAVT